MWIVNTFMVSKAGKPRGVSEHIYDGKKQIVALVNTFCYVLFAMLLFVAYNILYFDFQISLDLNLIYFINIMYFCTRSLWSLNNKMK